MKRLLAFIMIGVLSLALLLPSEALAGAKQRHRWEGVAIGLGAALLLGAMAHQAAAQPVFVESEPVYYAPPDRAWVPGHYEVRYVKEGYWTKVWMPEYYDAYGRHIHGYYEDRYVERERPARVWIPGYWE